MGAAKALRTGRPPGAGGETQCSPEPNNPEMIRGRERWERTEQICCKRLEQRMVYPDAESERGSNN